MKVRTSIFALATLIAASAAVPAMAGDWQSGGIPLAGSTTSNSVDATNVAAGVGNLASQDIHASQSGGKFTPRFGRELGMGLGPMGSPMVSNNTIVGTNVAAGIGNEADQDLGVRQGGGFGPGLVNNSVTGTNVAAGLGNLASQSIHARQK